MWCHVSATIHTPNISSTGFERRLNCHLAVAQLPYKSRISERMEFHPVYGSIMGPRGGDLAVVHLVRRAFETARWRTRVDTGRFSFPVGDNDRNVDDRHVAGLKDDETRRTEEEVLSDEL